MDIYIYIYSYIIDHCWILDIYLYTYIYSRLICVIKRTMIVKLFNDSHVSIILNHYYSLFHRINFRISCISVERIRRSKFFSAITRKIRTFECISLEFHETFTILSWRNSTDRREFDGSRNFDKRLRRKKMLAEGKSELCGKIWRAQARTTPRLYFSFSRESKRTIPASLLSTECLFILLNEIFIVLHVKIPAILCWRFGLQIFL